MKEKIGKQKTENSRILTGKVFSWNVINETTMIKKGDKSFFVGNGSAVPKTIKWFFGADILHSGERKKVYFIFLNREYPGRLEIDSLLRCRIFWNVELGLQFMSHYNPNGNRPPLIRFQKTDSDHYIIEFLDEELIENERCNSFDLATSSECEGQRKEYYISKYERNPNLRKKAIQIHGTKCMICGFDFEATYGEAGRNFIEVHHLKPLSSLKEKAVVNPETDLACICSNCHRIIHRKKEGVYTILEVKKMLDKSAS